MKKNLLFIFILIYSYVIAQNEELPHNHFFIRDSLVFSDSVLIQNIISNNQSYFPKVHSLKNNLHQLNYSFFKEESNWVSKNFIPLYDENNLIVLDSNVQMNMRYSYALSVDHIFDLNYRRKLTNHILFFDFSRTASIANFNHSEVSGMNFRIGLLDTIGKFENKIMFINNRWSINENGGIKNLEEIKGTPSLPNLELFTNLNTANNNIKKRIFIYENEYHFISIKDSLQSRISSIIGLKYLSEGYKFTMDKQDIDSLFFDMNYLSYNLTNDSVGNIIYSPYLGLGFRNKRISFRNVFKRDLSYLDVFNQDKIEAVFGVKTPRILFDLQIDYRLSGIWKNGLVIKNNLNWKNKFELKYDYRRILPNYFYLNYFGNHFNWDNHFKEQIDHVIKLKINTKSKLLKFNFEIYNLSNYVYLNEKSIPEQNNGTISLVKGQLNLAYHKKFFISENKFTYQQKTNSILRVPNYFIESTQAINFKILKMPLSFGGSIVYFPKHAGLAYNPNLRNYYIQNNQEVGGFPMLDVFLGAKAGGAELFLKVQNLFYPILDGSSFIVYENMVTIPNFIRVGFNWKILD